MNIILFDEPSIRQDLLPLTFTRPVAEMRVGILTIAEKWGEYMGASVSYLTQPYLQDKYELNFGIDNIYINGAVCPDEALVQVIRELKMGEALYLNGLLVAINGDNLEMHTLDELIKYSSPVRRECGPCVI
ncbi:MAG: glucose-1-phosphate thymidylyltransferase, partial [Pontibacter sp.]|nr:glucose-1-phosphate thymidylyltransferase [Pontibacter sp.]